MTMFFEKQSRKCLNFYGCKCECNSVCIVKPYGTVELREALSNSRYGFHHLESCYFSNGNWQSV